MKLERKMNRVKVALRVLGLFFSAGALLAGCTPQFPDYKATAKNTPLPNLRGMRYCELFFIGGNPITKNLYADVFNTSFLNEKADPRDSCPEGVWSKVDGDALAKQYHALKVFKNGPRAWTIDYTELPISPDVVTFDGLQARWFMTVDLPKNIEVGEKGGTAYKPTVGHRNSAMKFDKGKPVFILESPNGMSWVMQAYSMIVDPALTYEGLQTLDKKLKLPPGWKYRVKVLEDDLTIRALNGNALLVQDDLENTYDACFKDGGQQACSINP